MAQLRATIAELEAILGRRRQLRDRSSRTRSTEIRDEFATPRQTTLEYDDGDLEIEDLIDDEEVVVVMTARGYIKTVSVGHVPHPGPRRARRGRRQAQGRGLHHRPHPHLGARVPVVLLQPGQGLPAQGAPDPPAATAPRRAWPSSTCCGSSRTRRSRPIIDTRDYETHRYLFFVTRNGVVKKTMFNAYDSSRQDGLIAVNLREGDELVRVHPHLGGRRDPAGLARRVRASASPRTTCDRWAAPRRACGA